MNFAMVPPRIPLGQWADAAIDWMSDNWDAFFTAISNGLSFLLDGLGALLSALPYFAVIIIFAAIGWYLRGWKFGVFTALSFLLVASMELWRPTMSTMAMVLVASGIAVVIGVLLGVLASANRRASTIIKPVLDFMQTMPAFVYLIPAIIFFGIGMVPGTIATIVFALPPAARLTELGLRSVDPEVVEAGIAFGATKKRILLDIKMPLALPTIMSGINQVIMLALSMVVTAGIVGAGGLGSVVYQGVTRLDIGLGFEGGIAVVIVAVFLDRITSALGTRANRRINKG